MAVAQLVEPQIVVLVVAGSSPVGHPNSRLCQSGFAKFGRALFRRRRIFFSLSKSSSVVASLKQVVYDSQRFQILATDDCGEPPCW